MVNNISIQLGLYLAPVTRMGALEAQWASLVSTHIAQQQKRDER